MRSVQLDQLHAYAMHKGTRNLGATEADSPDPSRAPQRVWVFAQSDRAQREIYRDHLNALLEENGRVAVEWTEMASVQDNDDCLEQESLVLFDVDETKVEYC